MFAEQKKEVTEIFNAWNKRPVEWLLENLALNKKWCLIHCTQMLDYEARLLAETGAVIGLCPITEANLGDGIFNGKNWLKEGGKFGIGTDSNIKISLFEELRTLEYSQRLKYRKRIVLQKNNSVSIGRDLIESILHGGKFASGRKTGKIKVGFWADILALDLSSFNYSLLSDDEKLNYLIFSENEKIIDSVFSAGRWVVKEGKHIDRKKIIAKYGAVSFETCLSMVKNLSKISGTNISLSITGIAGPKGGTKKKPVGLVYIGLKKGNKIVIKKYYFKNKNRNSIQKATVIEALNLILSIFK